MERKGWQNRYKREKEKQVYRQFEDWSREELIDHILELRKELDENEEISKTESDSESRSENQFAETDYKQTWSYPTKVAFLLTLNKKPLNSEELEKLLRKYDTHFKDYKKPRNNLTVTLNRTVKSGRIRKVKVPGIRSLFYALPEWLDKEGNFKPAFAKTLNLFE